VSEKKLDMTDLELPCDNFGVWSVGLIIWMNVWV